VQVPVRIAVQLERVKSDAKGHPGKGHVTVNGAPLCETHTRHEFQHRVGGVERISLAQFVDDPCHNCLTRLEKKV